jgi:hypothetical protein
MGLAIHVGPVRGHRSLLQMPAGLAKKLLLTSRRMAPSCAARQKLVINGS